MAGVSFVGSKQVQHPKSEVVALTPLTSSTIQHHDFERRRNRHIEQEKKIWRVLRLLAHHLLESIIDSPTSYDHTSNPTTQIEEY